METALFILFIVIVNRSDCQRHAVVSLNNQYWGVCVLFY